MKLFKKFDKGQRATAKTMDAISDEVDYRTCPCFPEELYSETTLYDLWEACAWDGSFKDESINTIEVFVSPTSYSKLLRSKLRIGYDKTYNMHGGFQIKFFITREVGYSIKGFSHHEM